MRKILRPIRTIFSLLAAALLVIGCKGDDGPAGPPGTANVLYSAWFTAPAYDTATVAGIRHFSYTRAAPEITQSILDNGVVLTYGKLLGYNSQVWPLDRVEMLPIEVRYVQGNLQLDRWAAHASPGNLRIDFSNSNNFYTSISNAHSFRYVIIPGGSAISAAAVPSGMSAGVVAGGRAYTRAELQALSYDEVRRLFNIPD